MLIDIGGQLIVATMQRRPLFSAHLSSSMRTRRSVLGDVSNTHSRQASALKRESGGESSTLRGQWSVPQTTTSSRQPIAESPAPAESGESDSEIDFGPVDPGIVADPYIQRSR